MDSKKMRDENQEQKHLEDDKMESSTSAISSPDFMREKIKQRPLNRKKLLRRTLITVTMAVVFGAVACLTFVFLSPVINNKLYPEDKATPVALTEDTVTDEMQPEDMYADDNAIAAEAASAAIDMASNEINRMQEQIKMTSHEIDYTDFRKMYASLKEVANSASRSIVTVTGVSSDTNWFNNPYESEGKCSGIIVAENGQDYLILVSTSAIAGAKSIQVTFNDGAVCNAYLKMSDNITGFSIIAVRERIVTDETKNSIGVANLGNSNSSVVTGTPVIAIGSPTGIQGSINYGFATSGSMKLDLADSNYKLLTTDIYGSTNATGALIDLSGAVIGFIDMSHNSDSLSNMLSAVGVTELRSLIEDLSNGTGRSYLGLHGQSVPVEIQSEMNVPAGAYISRTDMDSPGMLAGIQSGDIITAIDDTVISNYESMVNELIRLHPGKDINVTLMRQAADGYVELNIDMTIASSTDMVAED